MNLVTGATGHIGNVLVRTLLEKGHKVRTLVLPGEDLSPLQGLDVEILEGDVLCQESLEPAFAGVDVVFHLAGLISILPRRDDLVERVEHPGHAERPPGRVERWRGALCLHQLDPRH